MSQDEPNSNPHRIGAMNGPYAILFKVALVTYPVILSAATDFAVWVTNNIYEFRSWTQAGPRFTSVDAKVLVAEERESARRERAGELNQVRTELTAKLETISTRLEAQQLANSSVRETLAEIKFDLRSLNRASEVKPTVQTK